MAYVRKTKDVYEIWVLDQNSNKYGLFAVEDSLRGARQKVSDLERLGKMYQLKRVRINDHVKSNC